MTAEKIIEAAKSRRAAQGFRLDWRIPSEGRNFTAYAKDEVQKQAWLARAEADGWERFVRITVLPNQTFRGVLHFEETNYDVSTELAAYAVEQGVAKWRD